MSHTNSTANYQLPQFLGTDKPAWLTDVNQAYADIDTAMKANEVSAGQANALATQNASAISTMSGQISTLSTKVTALETAQPTDEAQIETNRQNIATNAQNIVGIDNRLGHEDISAIGDDITDAIVKEDAKVGDLADLDTTDKTSIVDAINEVVAGGGGDTSTVRYYNGWIQYSTDGGTTWVDWINTVNPVNIIPVLTANDSSQLGVASGASNQQTGAEAYKAFIASGYKLQNADDFAKYAFNVAHPATSIVITLTSNSSHSIAGDVKVQYTEDGTNWVDAGANTVTAENATETLTFAINASVLGIRAIKSTGSGMFTVTNFNVKG